MIASLNVGKRIKGSKNRGMGILGSHGDLIGADQAVQQVTADGASWSIGLGESERAFA
jgi:hypothetical protein